VIFEETMSLLLSQNAVLRAVLFMIVSTHLEIDIVLAIELKSMDLLNH
jgi:hypothetical protein